MIIRRTCWALVIGCYVLLFAALISSTFSCAAFTASEQAELAAIQTDIDTLVTKISTGELSVKEGLETAARIQGRLETLRGKGYSLAELLIGMLSTFVGGGILLKSPGVVAILGAIKDALVGKTAVAKSGKKVA